MENEFSIVKKKITSRLFFGWGYHIFFTDSNRGDLWGAGSNSSFQLGIGSRESQNKPVKINFFKPMSENSVLAVSLGKNHSLFQTISNDFFTSGYNGSGQCSVKKTSDYVSKLTPVCVLNSSDLISGIAGSQASYFLSSKGEVFSAGCNGNGALCHGDKKDRFQATKIESLAEEFITKVIGGFHNVAFITKSDRIFMGGYNGYSQLGRGRTTDQLVPFELEYFSKRCIAVHDVVLGYHSTYFLVEKDQVYCAGSGIHGEMGNSKVSSSKFPKLCPDFGRVERLVSTYHFTVFKTKKGEIFGTGLNGEKGTMGFGKQKKILTPQRIKFPKDIKVIQFGASLESVYFLTEEGDVYGAGLNCYGQLMNSKNDNENQIVFLCKI